MRVRDVMTPDPVSVTPRTSVAEARRLMQRHRIRHLPVVDHGRLVGIVSDRDVVLGDPQLRTALAALHSDLLSGAERPVAELLHAPVHTAAADEDLAAAAARLRDRRVNALPVVDGDRLVGMLTTSDCLQVLEDPQLAADLAREAREMRS